MVRKNGSRRISAPRRPRSPVPRHKKCSASFIITATNCPLQAFRDSFLEIRMSHLPMTVLGTAVHGLFEKSMRRDKRTKRYPYATIKKLTGAWWRFWSTAAYRPTTEPERKNAHGFEGYGTPWHDVAWASYPDEPDRLRQSGCAYMAMFHKTFDPYRQSAIPIWVERNFQFWWEGIYWTGRVDTILFEPDGAILVDYKPSYYSEPVRLTGVQATLYQLAYEVYFRKHAPKRLPLKAIWIYNYKSGQIQNVPLRDSHEFGMLVKFAQESSYYYGGALHSIEVPPAFQPTLDVFHFADIAHGDISPRLPRGDHCKYCSHIEACRQWERGELPTAREQYQQKLELVVAAKAPLQTRIPFAELPVVQRVIREYSYLFEPKPKQGEINLETDP